MKKIDVCCVEEFCEIYNETVKDISGSYTYAEIVANYDEARVIVRELVFYGYEIAQVELVDPAFDGYDGEFSIAIINDEIYCERAKVDGKYPGSGATIAYFIDDVSHKATSAYDKNTVMYEVHIEDDEDELECDRDFDNYLLNDDGTDISIAREDDGMHGFTVTQSDDHGCSSYSYYSTDTIDGYTLKRLLDIFVV
ncbi:hypothetical protein ACQRDF_13715 [Lachnospiraceae bacterium SGI.054]